MGNGINRLEDLDKLGSTRHLQHIPMVSRRDSHGRSLPDYMLETPCGEFADAVRALRGGWMTGQVRRSAAWSVRQSPPTKLVDHGETSSAALTRQGGGRHQRRRRPAI